MSETTVIITIRVESTDPTRPRTECTTALLFDADDSEVRRRDVVGNAARNIYPRAAGVSIPTPLREGGRG